MGNLSVLINITIETFGPLRTSSNCYSFMIKAVMGLGPAAEALASQIASLPLQQRMWDLGPNATKAPLAGQLCVVVLGVVPAPTLPMSL